MRDASPLLIGGDQKAAAEGVKAGQILKLCGEGAEAFRVGEVPRIDDHPGGSAAFQKGRVRLRYTVVVFGAAVSDRSKPARYVNHEALADLFPQRHRSESLFRVHTSNRSGTRVFRLGGPMGEGWYTR